MAMMLVNVLEKLVKLQEKSGKMSEKEINVEFDSIILQKTPIERNEPTDEKYYLRRLNLREYFRDLRRILSVHKSYAKKLVL